MQFKKLLVNWLTSLSGKFKIYFVGRLYSQTVRIIALSKYLQLQNVAVDRKPVRNGWKTEIRTEIVVGGGRNMRMCGVNEDKSSDRDRWETYE